MSDNVEDQIYELHEVSERLLDEGDILAALETARKARAIVEANADDVPLETAIDTLFLLAGVLIEADRPGEALDLYEQISELEPGNEELLFCRGVALLHLAKFKEARPLIEGCLEVTENEAEARWHLAVIAEFLGDDEEANRLFREAHRLQPETLPEPIRMGPREVESLLNGVIEELPEEVRTALDNVVIQVEPLPSAELLREGDPPLSPFVLGLHVGSPWGDQSVFAQPTDLDRILIFQRNIERIAADPEGLREQLHITLLHEIGHHLGWDEEDLADRGLD
jgi:predicted Zn-dependent protease with MMP-like domain